MPRNASWLSVIFVCLCFLIAVMLVVVTIMILLNPSSIGWFFGEIVHGYNQAASR